MGLLFYPVFSDCDVSLFELALQLREKRLDIEEALVEEKKVLDNLKKEFDTLSKKVCSAFSKSIYPPSTCYLSSQLEHCNFIAMI